MLTKWMVLIEVFGTHYSTMFLLRQGGYMKFRFGTLLMAIKVTVK